MRAAKAWRCFFDLPSDPILASGLTALIDMKVNLHITSHDGIEVKIEPAFIVDIPCKGRRFQLVAETVFEHQAEHGPKLTAMTDQAVSLTILSEQETSAPPQQQRGTISERALKGLHVAFFKNQKFMKFFSVKVVAHIENERECKAEFKKYLGVQSCREINQEDFDRILAEFNAWLNGAGNE